MTININKTRFQISISYPLYTYYISTAIRVGSVSPSYGLKALEGISDLENLERYIDCTELRLWDISLSKAKLHDLIDKAFLANAFDADTHLEVQQRLAYSMGWLHFASNLIYLDYPLDSFTTELIAIFNDDFSSDYRY